MTTVAKNIVDTLVASGVKRVYGIPGDSLNGFTDALRGSGIEWVHVRHEEAGAFAAGAEAALTGEIAVAVGSAGPGNLHLINGLYDAQRSRVPVLAIAAHIPTEEIGSGYFQETHPQELFREASVYSEYVSSPTQMPRILRTAMQTALEKRGVAVVVIPGDIALAEAVDTTVTPVRATRPRVLPSQDELVQAAALLNGSDRVTILAGAGAEHAHDQVVALAGKLAAPVVHTLRSKQFVEHDNPYDVGMTGLLGFASGYKAMEGADTLLMLGTDFPYRAFLPEKAKVAQIDLRGEHLGRRTALDLGLVGDVGDTVDALLPLLDQATDREHLDDSLAHYAKTRTKLDDLATPRKGDQPLHPQFVARVVDELAADDAVFIPDVGSPVIWAARYLKMNGRRNLIGSFIHGSMANALPQAVGAAAATGRQVVALSGDGGIAMLLGELLTLTQNRLPVKVVVFNNASLNFVELEMKAAGFVTHATGLENPSLAAIAQAAGLKAFRVERSQDLRGALAEAFAYDGPALVDVVTERQELTIPPSVKLDQAKGFALYALRTLLSGRGDELLDLTRANLRQVF
ncbi:ubiquinone-dependent pyruvate dehydrogenase [Cellulomonas fimi]|uniref:Pyruvate dehydrogenase [ubiquinone] n=1 Tax=Cellulomonas fimi (strain ATCC 484 / DSM 20113 / JCM 1341 / CCUG 24087 / LMG 16345 / NBRC 15513 / NCIMB 8980 / NCTC 7547 / NRS-133) TaxID=590998 RepID=F4H598_CELFA|nr:ubiquinone-dependent pyruvate dehydrogenase [Cellulomonas fimi]AEE46704.1 thiamine pyrophosphate TPP-binding domain-containing protein [Cellulomonas fimi ATCC 484]NNH07651.1 ubiquinone-dependent pyruvate dehydrogenase [Cellulomonas fimi]VEH33933.1 Pyruvate dehydrogenase [ubiquinone] [Cellulomonas fimi]